MNGRALVIGAMTLGLLTAPALAVDNYQRDDGIAQKGSCTLGPATLSQDGNGDPKATAPYTCNDTGSNQTRILTLVLMVGNTGGGSLPTVYESAQVTVNGRDSASGTLQVGPNTSCSPSGTSEIHTAGLKIKYETHGTDLDLGLSQNLFIHNCS